MLSTEGLPSVNTMNIGLTHLHDYLSRRRDIYEPKIQPKVDYKNILMLGYYRNPLNYVYFNEGVILVSMFYFDKEKVWNTNEGVDMNLVFERASFIADLLKREEVIEHRISKKSPEVF